MKKILIILSSIIALTTFMILGKSLLFNEKENVTETYQVKNENVLSMMLEQNIGAGDYEMTTRSSWPTIEDGYIFNSTLSKCENGSKLSWNEELNVVVMSGNVSDKCYMYFDRLVPPVVVDVITNNPMNGRDLKIDVYSEGLYKIKSYYYSIDNGQTFVESDAANYYNEEAGKWETLYIQVYVVDIYGQKSNIFSTSQYVNCFVAGTKVQTLNGLVNIEDIKIGDYVYTINETTNKKELKRVENTITSSTKITYDITAGNTIVEPSPRHQFYIVDKGWIRAYNLEVGDMILTTNGAVKIEDIKVNYHEQEVTTYNLSVEDNHNFLVTSNEFLVHNEGSEIDPWE